MHHIAVRCRFSPIKWIRWLTKVYCNGVICLQSVFTVVALEINAAAMEITSETIQKTSLSMAFIPCPRRLSIWLALPTPLYIHLANYWSINNFNETVIEHDRETIKAGAVTLTTVIGRRSRAHNCSEGWRGELLREWCTGRGCNYGRD